MAALAQAGAQAVPVTAATPGDAPDMRPPVYRGKGFDTCQAPPLTTLSAWGGTSAYGAVGVYYGGRARACPNQRYLSHRWVYKRQVYVGSQSPCVRASSKRGYPIGDYPEDQGIDEGRDAVRSAAALGIAAGSPLYLDMEAYDYGDEECGGLTLDYIRSWNATVSRLGYMPGLYSSAESGVRHMELARRDGLSDLPEVLWFARWKVPASPDHERVLPSGAWQPHRRIHQYAGNVTETYGGRKLTIDRNAIDAPVAIIH